jgi:ABC-type branched-subunit amino acid transport system substrate-binding protein
MAAAAGTVAFAGCAEDQNPDSSPGSEGNGDDESGSTAEDLDNVKIGFLAPLSQPGGKTMKQSTEYFADQSDINYDITTKDTQFSPQKAEQAARSLINSQGVDLLVGGFAPQVGLALQEMVSGDGPIFLNAAMASDVATKRLNSNYDAYKYYFAGGLSEGQQARSYAEYFNQVVAQDTDVESFGMLNENVGNIPTLSKAIVSHLEDAGFTHKKTIQFARGTDDLRPSLNTMEDAGVDAAIPLATVSAPILTQQWAQLESNFQLIAGPPQILKDSWPETVGKEAAETNTMSAIITEAPVTEQTADWWSGFTEFNGTSPQNNSGRAWVMLKTYEEAIKQVGDKSAYDDIVTEMRESGAQTVFGKAEYNGPDSDLTHFLKYGSTDLLKKTWFQWQMSDGELQKKTLHPAEWADHDGEQQFQLADWVDL